MNVVYVSKNNLSFLFCQYYFLENLQENLQILDSTAFLRNNPSSSRFFTNSAKQIFSYREKSCDRSYTENRFCCRQMFHNHLSGYRKQ